ncbi:MAG: DoxX family protein [Thaumarchaeota archaeon]|nr:DoxX family protein [Nitrososphaerota archaeon]
MFVGQRVKDHLIDLPRYGVMAVFLWAGIDKFLLHQYYTSWFSSSETISFFFPFHHPGISVYVVGTGELCIATLLFLNFKTRVVSMAVIGFLALTLFAAGYPASFPEDLGLIGIAMMLVLIDDSSQEVRKQRLVKYWPLASYSISGVLSIWAYDYLAYSHRHAAWIHQTSPIFYNMGATNLVNLSMVVGMAEVILAVLMLLGVYFKSMYPFLMTSAFLVFGIIALDPPVITIQTVGFIVVSIWLAHWCFSCQKNRIPKNMENR